MGLAPAPSPLQRVSFVMPAFDEERRLGASLGRLVAYCATQPYTSEIIVVDDGSDDATASIATAAQSKAEDAVADRVSLRVLRHERNRGKGAAVRTGMLASNGECAIYLDADLATPPEETAKLLAAIEAGSDIAIGVRIQPGGYDMRNSEPFYRRVGGRIFTGVRKQLLLRDIHDTQCGFKAFRREAAQVLVRQQQLDGWAFDAELLFLAQRLGYSIAQVPVEWRHVEGSKFQISAGSALRELRDLARIRWLHRNASPIR